MDVKIAFLSDDDARPLQRSVSRAASRAHMHPHQMAMAVMYWMEEVANETADGNVVNIPGFGAFFPYVFERIKNGRPSIVTPRFQASVSYRSEVAATCSPGQVHGGNKKYRNYQRNHNISRDPDLRRRVCEPFEVVRQTLRKEAEALGQDL